MPETKVEVTRGEFDPRDWAKKRRTDWLAAAVKIIKTPTKTDSWPRKRKTDITSLRYF